MDNVRREFVDQLDQPRKNQNGRDDGKMRKLIEVWVGGRPRTKGSLRPVRTPGGQIRQVEEVKGSKAWRTTVSNTVIPEILDEVKVDGMRSRWRLREGWPNQSVVIVAARFYFDRPKSNTDPFPTAVTFGDTDKLLRNVLDALKDARVYADDSQVADVSGCKRFVESTALGEGASITVWSYE